MRWSAGLAAIAESLAGFSAACIEAGAAGIYFSAQGGDASRFTAEEHLQLHQAARRHRAGGGYRGGRHCNILHICGRGIRFDHYVGLSGAHGELGTAERQPEPDRRP